MINQLVYISLLESNQINNIPFDEIFKNIIKKIKNNFGYDLSYMKLQISEIPVYNDGRPNKKMNPDEFGGSWTKNKTIYINKNPSRVIKYWKLKISEIEFINLIIAHELGHELWKNHNMRNNNIPKKFNTVYLDTVKPEKMEEERFCEYFAYQITNL